MQYWGPLGRRNNIPICQGGQCKCALQTTASCTAALHFTGLSCSNLTPWSSSFIPGTISWTVPRFYIILEKNSPLPEKTLQTVIPNTLVIPSSLTGKDWSKYIGQYMKSRIIFSQSKTRQILPIMVFHTRGWWLNRLNGVGFCRELSGILQTCCFSWKGHIWVQKWHQPKGIKYISRMETNNRLDANEYQLTEEQRGRQSQLHDSYKEIS